MGLRSPVFGEIYFVKWIDVSKVLVDDVVCKRVANNASTLLSAIALLFCLCCTPFDKLVALSPEAVAVKKVRFVRCELTDLRWHTRARLSKL